MAVSGLGRDPLFSTWVRAEGLRAGPTDADPSPTLVDWFLGAQVTPPAPTPGARRGPYLVANVGRLMRR